MVSDIESIAQTIWETLFQSSLTPGGNGLGEQPRVTCLVPVHGAFEGAVMIQCHEALGSKLTDAMLQGATAPTAEDMTDALGELTNMFAGNLKSVLAKPSTIALPRVAFGPHDQLVPADTTVVARVPFMCDEHSLVVTVFELPADAGGPLGPAKTASFPVSEA